MEIIQIEIKNKNALPILKSLEKAKMIKVLNNIQPERSALVNLKGTISTERAIELAKEIDKSRSEWDERTI